MPHKTQRVRSEDLTIHRFWGSVTFDDCTAAAQEVADAPSRLVLCDFHFATSINLHADKIQQLIQVVARAKRPPGSRTAIFSPRVDLFGTARQMQSYAEVEQLSYEVRAFRVLDDALNWLKEHTQSVKQDR